MHCFSCVRKRIFAHDTQKVRKITKIIWYTQEKSQKTCVFVKKAVILQPKLKNIMSELIDHATLSAMYRRWAYMLIAIASAAFMFTRPVFNFQSLHHSLWYLQCCYYFCLFLLKILFDLKYSLKYHSFQLGILY